MTIPVNALTWLAAFLPIMALLILMLKCQMSASEAAPLGLFAAVAVAMLCYRTDFAQIAMDCTKGLWNAFAIVIVIFPAVLIYEVSNRSGSTDVFLRTLSAFSPNELLRILAAGAVFPSFLQGITGFGVPVAVGASLLLAMGVRAVPAVIIPLLGQAWGGTFGTLAVAWDALASQAGLTPGTELLRTAFYSALFIWVWNFISLLGICWVYGRGAGIRKGLPAVLVLSLVQGGGELLFSQLHQTLACFIPACLALVAVGLLGKTPWYRSPWVLPQSTAMQRDCAERKAAPDSGMTVHQAFLPYYTLTAVTLAVLLIRPLGAWLGQWRIGPAFPEMSTGYGYVSAAVPQYAPIAPLTHAGLFLFLSACIGYRFYRRKRWLTKTDGRNIITAALGKTIPSGVAVAGFIMMSRVMSGSGQTLVLAQGIAGALGELYLALTPLVGMMGSFLTSSNMSSNILFGEFQNLTAELLGMDAAPILGAHTAGASIGNAIAPGSIILGSMAAGLPGAEGQVLKKILPFALLGVAAIGLLTIAVLWGGAPV